MKNQCKLNILSVAVCLLSGINIFSAHSQQASSSIILSSVEKEVNRNLSGLKIDKLATPFFISYAVTDEKELVTTASFGSLIKSTEKIARTGYPFLLVGSYNSCNIGYFDMQSMYGRPTESSILCLNDNPKGIATSVWLDLDKCYKRAAEQYQAKLGIVGQQNTSEDEKDLPDYEKVESKKVILNVTPADSRKKYWEDFACKLSEIANKYPDIIRSKVTIANRIATIYYYNTEGTYYSIPDDLFTFQFDVTLITPDGQEISDYYYCPTNEFKDIPDLQSAIGLCEKYLSDFVLLNKAPLIQEVYSGPVLIEGMALGEVISERLFDKTLIAKKKPVLSQELTERGYASSPMLAGNSTEMMAGKEIISKDLTVKSITGKKSYNGQPLYGYIPIDYQGVIPSEELVLVEKGILKNMLNGRIPTSKFPHSNGHERISMRYRQTTISSGNVQITSEKTFPKQEMKTKLLETAREQNLEYAYILKRGRDNNIGMLYRVSVADGSETLVRGAAFVDFNLKSFKRILGCSDNNFVYHRTKLGLLNSYVLPESMLFEDIEISKNPKLVLKTSYLVVKP